MHPYVTMCCKHRHPVHLGLPEEGENHSWSPVIHGPGHPRFTTSSFTWRLSQCHARNLKTLPASTRHKRAPHFVSSPTTTFKKTPLWPDAYRSFNVRISCHVIKGFNNTRQIAHLLYRSDNGARISRNISSSLLRFVLPSPCPEQ